VRRRWPGQRHDHRAGQLTPAYIRERIAGSFSRRVYLGDAVDSGKVEAGYESGVLTVRVPLAEAAKPRKVEIQTEAPKGLTA
jgi:HSP20 family protein